MAPESELGPDPTMFCLAQAYEVQVERYLMGSGPETIRTAQVEGEIDRPITPTAARVKVLRSWYEDYVPMAIGDRYLFLLYETFTVPEIDNLEVWPGGAPPSRYLLTPDGLATPEGAGIGPKGSVPSGCVGGIFPRVTEVELLARIESLVADLSRK